MDTDFLKTCDILLYQGTSLTSRLIRWGTKSPYSHVAVVVHREMNLAIESNTGHQAGVRALDLRKLDGEKIHVFRIRDEFLFDPKKVISYLVSRLGSDYDTGGVAYLGILKLLRLRHAANRFQKEKDYFCSELVYEAFEAAGLDIIPQVNEADITSPGDIAQSAVLQRVPERAERPLSHA